MKRTNTSIKTYKKAYNKMVTNNSIKMTFEEYLESCARRNKKAKRLGII